jgi:SHS2 domain-containing protein
MYRWVDHTAEVELEIEAQSEEEILAEALRALAELLGASGDEHGAERRAVSVAADDRPALLAAWLEELVFLAEAEGFVATEIEQLELSAYRARAMVRGSLAGPPPLVKAVTYHRLQFEAADRGYRAVVVLDV